MVVFVLVWVINYFQSHQLLDSLLKSLTLAMSILPEEIPVAFTTSASKEKAAKDLGADEVIISKDEAQMAKHMRSFDLIIDTVAASHNLDAYTQLLKRDGTHVLLGAPETPHPSPMVFNLIFGRRSLAGSLIGGIKETQEMLDFCGQHGIVADVEMVRIQDVNTAWERLLKADVKFRFVIDMASLRG